MPRADLLIVGHNGSRTSLRNAQLGAVGAKLFTGSCGFEKYETVTLPDKIVIDDLTERGTVFRSDEGDTTCRRNKHKVRTDNDGSVGGCSNIVFTIDREESVSGRLAFRQCC